MTKKTEHTMKLDFTIEPYNPSGYAHPQAISLCTFTLPDNLLGRICVEGNAYIIYQDGMKDPEEYICEYAKKALNHFPNSPEEYKPYQEYLEHTSHPAQTKPQTFEVCIMKYGPTPLSKDGRITASINSDSRITFPPRMPIVNQKTKKEIGVATNFYKREDGIWATVEVSDAASLEDIKKHGLFESEE